jgi:hypothetical protein
VLHGHVVRILTFLMRGKTDLDMSLLNEILHFCEENYISNRFIYVWFV